MRSRPAFFCLFRFFAYFAFFRRRLPHVPYGARLFFLFCVGRRVSHGTRLFFSYFASVAAYSSRSTLFCLFCVGCRVSPYGARFSAYFASVAACPLRSTPFLFHSPSPPPFSSSFSAFLAFRIFKRLPVPLTIITSASKSATT